MLDINRLNLSENYNIRRLNITKFEIKDNLVYTYTEYNKHFIDIAHRLNGKWRDGAWIFNIDLKEEVENVLIDIFGYNQNKIDVYLYIENKSFDSEFYLVGKQIFQRKYRDSSVIIHSDVSILEGKLKSSGGSMKHPTIGNIENMKILIRNVPENLLHELKEYKYEIKENTNKSKYSSYSKEELELMLKEIQEELNKR